MKFLYKHSVIVHLKSVAFLWWFDNVNTMESKEQKRISHKRWRDKNPESYKAYCKRNLENIKKKYRDNPEFRKRKKEYSKKYQKENAEKIKKYRQNSAVYKESTRKYNLIHHNKQREYWLKRKYGITSEQFDIMSEAQNHVCAICGNPQTHNDKWNSPHRRLRVDHDHAAGKVRGLLCTTCNAGIGHFNDSLLLLSNAVKYLKKYID